MFIPNKLVAALLAIILGGLGIHKFYLHKPAQGIFYLLFCWTGLPMLIGFIEGLVYLSMSESNFAWRYNKPKNEKNIAF